MRSDKAVKELLRDLNDTDETEHLEAKEISGDQLGKSVYETICALSNEPDLGGGTILLGVTRENQLFPFYSATGVANPDHLSADLSSGCSTMFNVPVRVDITANKIGDAVVLKVNVPELPRNSKPLYFRATGLPRGAFRRIGPTDVRCTDEDLLTFFLGKGPDAYDAQIVRDASWEDIDLTAIQSYRASVEESFPEAESLMWTDEVLLNALGAVRWVDDKLRITTTGLLTFGKQQSIRRLFPSHRVDYIRVQGNQWVTDPDNPFESIDMRGPLLTLVPRVIGAIADDLPKAHRMNNDVSGKRTESPVIPTRVVREAVVNSLMHRSYQINKPVQIIRYSNRVEIRNPGYSLKSEDRFEDSGSTQRNPSIAEILHETRLAETKGTGMKVMRQKMAQAGLAAPSFETSRESDEFSVTFLFHHFLDERDLEWLTSFKGLELTEDQMQALIFVREVGAISNSVYRSLTQTDTLVASRNLRKLRTMDLLSEQGSGARTSYVAGPEMRLRLSMDASPDSMDGNVVAMDGSSGKTLSLIDLPVRLRIRVKAIQFKRRLKPIEAKDIIDAICSWRALSLEEIAALLGKTASHVSQKYVSPMVSEGRLFYLYPEMPQHPGQKYRTDKTGARSR